jgi:hypothetical protein
MESCIVCGILVEDSILLKAPLNIQFRKINLLVEAHEQLDEFVCLECITQQLESIKNIEAI